MSFLAQHPSCSRNDFFLANKDDPTHSTLQIKLIRKRSTKVSVGAGLDMERRANLLVTEVFDTELIGEAAIATFNHAHRNLLTGDCLVVPTHGTVFAQVVSSDLASRWNR